MELVGLLLAVSVDIISGMLGSGPNQVHEENKEELVKI
jgi:hypothetical protein